MKSAPHKITIFPRGDPALSVDSDAAGMSYHLTHHVLSQFVLRPFLYRRLRLGVGLAANRPLGDVVRPLMRLHAGGGITKPSTKKVSMLNNI